MFGGEMANLNKVFLIGRLTRDPDFKYIPSGAAVAEFGLAVNRYYVVNGERREDTCFIEVNVWGRQAETARDYLRKGRQIFLEGHLVFDQWQTQDGQKRSRIRVTAESLQFLDSSGRSEGGPRQTTDSGVAGGPSVGGPPPSQQGGSGEMPEGPPPGGESEVPF
jgi:single-strand DNA-binding protein